MQIPFPKAKRRARIEIIPLIDIMFFLLATFVMVSLSMIKNQAIPIQLPVASSSVSQDRNDFTSITVSDNGTFFWNKEIMDLNTIVSKLQQLKQKQSDPKIFINGAAKAHFEDVISILDEARKNGISKVAIETTKNK